MLFKAIEIFFKRSFKNRSSEQLG